MSSLALSGTDHFDRNKKESNTEYPLQGHVRHACRDLRTKKATDEKSKTNQSGSSEIDVSLPVVSSGGQDADGGGTSNARVVPWAACCEKPNMRTSAGTTIVPPPIPIMPLNIPATSPRRMYS